MPSAEQLLASLRKSAYNVLPPLLESTSIMSCRSSMSHWVHFLGSPQSKVGPSKLMVGSLGCAVLPADLYLLHLCYVAHITLGVMLRSLGRACLY